MPLKSKPLPKSKMLMISLLIVVILLVGVISITFAELTPVKTVTIYSEKKNYDDYEAGAWKVDKSAEWEDYGKAEITFDVSTIMKSDTEYSDIFFVLDISGSMDGEKLQKVKEDATSLISSLLTNKNNQAALITFDTTSEIIEELTNDEEKLISEIYGLETKGNTNYYQALVNVESLLKNYKPQSNRECIVLFLTDGYPNENTPNQIAQFQYIKNAYPFVTINGVQYEMGDEVLEPIKEISDRQFIAEMESLNNVLFEASVAPMSYEDFTIVDYIDTDYFTVESERDIKVSQGNVEFSKEEQKITWHISKLVSGQGAQMTIKAKLKNEYLKDGGIFPTNEKEEIKSKIDSDEENVESTETPILSSHYNVIYEENAPDDCQVENIPKQEKHAVFETVEISSKKPSCEGYQFKGWEIVTESAEKVNDDYFVMPGENVHIRAKWSKLQLQKSMNGKVVKVQTLYNIMKDASKQGTKEEVLDTNVDFSSAPTDDDSGVYKRSGTENDTYPIYYYRGNISNNNVIFNNMCWKMVITTKTGGVKLIYNGLPSEEGTCDNTKSNAQVTTKVFNGSSSSPADVGYMYGTRYTYSELSIRWHSIVGKSRTYQSSMSSHTYYYSNTVSWDGEKYTLDNPEAHVWSSDRTQLYGYYTCKTENEENYTCSTVYWVDTDNSSSSYMYYVEMSNGETYDSLYNQAENTTWEFGNDVTYNEETEEYLLVDSIKIHPLNWSNEYKLVLNAHHYTFSDSTSKSSVKYLCYIESSSVYYITLSNGKKVEDALEEMFSRNQINSTMKTYIEDTWYKEKFLNEDETPNEYAEKIEDTVYCNDRSISNLGSWDNDAASFGYLDFGASNRVYDTHIPSLECDKLDSFTVSSEIGNGKLKFPVGLLSTDEAMLAGGRNSANSKYYLYTGSNYWLLSPYGFNYRNAEVFRVNSYGNLDNYNGYVRDTYGVRPVISLIHDTMTEGGTGTVDDPYTIAMNVNADELGNS